MTTYDPDLIRKMSNRLGAQAVVSTIASTLLGGVVGLVASPFILQSLPGNIAVDLPNWACPATFAMVGLARGLGQAAEIRMKAQTMLCLLQIEENSRAHRLASNPDRAS